MPFAQARRLRPKAFRRRRLLPSRRPAPCTALTSGMVGGKAGETEMAKGADMGRGRLLVFDAVSMDAQSAADIESLWNQ